MLEWIKSNTSRLQLGVLVLGLLVMFLSLNSYSRVLWGGESYNREKLASLEGHITGDPYNASLLLEAARHSYHLARKEFRDQRTRPPRDVLQTGLKYYRRLLSNDEWHVEPRDYFYASYLYHKLGDHYLGRAKQLALRAYNKNYRSRELITLLATVQFQQATSREDYQIALNYYRSLGTDLKDPVLLYNKALTLRNLGKTDRALELLDSGQDHLHRVEEPEVLERQYRLARVRIHIDQGRIRTALRSIEQVPKSERGLHLRTLHARCLIELERTSQARSMLEEIVSRPNSPDKAKTLLKNITEQQNARS